MARLLLALLVLGRVLLAGTLLFCRQPNFTRTRPASASPPAATSTPPPTATATAASDVAREYRLAGVAVGGPGAYAVIANPDGQTALYRPGDEVPGLGRLLRVEEKRAIISSSRGDVEFRIRRAPTATPAPATPSRPYKRVTPTTPSPAPAGNDGE